MYGEIAQINDKFYDEKAIGWLVCQRIDFRLFIEIDESRDRVLGLIVKSYMLSHGLFGSNGRAYEVCCQALCLCNLTCHDVLKGPSYMLHGRAQHIVVLPWSHGVQSSFANTSRLALKPGWRIRESFSAAECIANIMVTRNPIASENSRDDVQKHLKTHFVVHAMGIASPTRKIPRNPSFAPRPWGSSRTTKMPREFWSC